MAQKIPNQIILESRFGDTVWPLCIPNKTETTGQTTESLRIVGYGKPTSGDLRLKT